MAGVKTPLVMLQTVMTERHAAGDWKEAVRIAETAERLKHRRLALGGKRPPKPAAPVDLRTLSDAELRDRYNRLRRAHARTGPPPHDPD